MENLYKKNISLAKMRQTSFSKYVTEHIKEHGAMKLVPDNEHMEIITNNWSAYLQAHPLLEQTEKCTRNLSRFGNGIYELHDETSTCVIEGLPQSSVVLTYADVKTSLFRKSLVKHTKKNDSSFSTVVFDVSYMQYLKDKEVGYPANWNLNALPIPSAFQSSTVYESGNSFTPLTVQPFDLPKACMLLPTSYSKFWCIIDPKDQYKLNDYLNRHRKRHCKSELLHRRSLMDFEILAKLNVNYWNAVQHPGELMILGAGTCFQSVTSGVSVSEEVFFYEKSLYTKCLQRSRCDCSEVAKSHSKRIFAEVRGMSSMIERLNYNVFNEDSSPSPSVPKETIKALDKRRREHDRYAGMMTEKKKLKRGNDKNRSRDAKDPGSIFFQHEVDKVQQRLNRIMRALEIHKDIKSDPNCRKKEPRRSVEELNIQRVDDEAIMEHLKKNRDRYNILKQIYCVSKGVLNANVSVGMTYDAIIRLFFDQTSKTNEEVWLLSVHNAIKEDKKRQFYKELIKDEAQWNEHFQLNHGVRIPWKDWIESRNKKWDQEGTTAAAQ